MEIHELSPHERAIEVAQQDVTSLLRFAAGHSRIAISEELTGNAVTVAGLPSKDFDAAKEQLLWLTLDRLARGVRPATIRSVRAIETLETSKLKPRPDQIIRRTRWMTLTFLLLLLILQVYALVGTSIVKETKGLEVEATEIGQRRAEFETLAGSAAATTNRWSERATQVGRRLDAENHMLALWVEICTDIFPWNWGRGDQVDRVMVNFVNDQSARVILDSLALYLLPLLYGTLGASVYVLRRVAYQVDRATFAPITWFVLTIRLSLGAVFGVTVGLLVVPQLRGSEATFLPAFALAFLAGYGVDAVFAVMDRWLYRLREEPESAQPRPEAQVAHAEPAEQGPASA